MKKRLPALFLALAMALTLLSAMPSNAFAANTTVDISGKTTSSSIESAIGDALNSVGYDGTVTVTGSTTTNYTVAIDIPAGVTLMWKAKLSSDYIKPPNLGYSGLISLSGAGILEIADGADLSMNCPVNGNITINVINASGNIKMTGGRVSSTAGDGFRCHTIGSFNSTVNLTVSGGEIIAAANGTGTANAIDFEESSGNVAIGGNAKITATSENNAENVVAIAYTNGDAHGDVTMMGGSITVSSAGGNATGIYTPNGNVSIREGTISVVTRGGAGRSADAVRLGDNDLARKAGPAAAGSVQISGGNISVGNAASSGLAFGVGVYNDGENVSVTGGTMSISASGSGGGAYGVYYPDNVRGNVTMTGGSISSSAAQHAYGIRLANGAASVSGGKITAASTALPPWAAFVAQRGILAFLEGTYDGRLVIGSSAVGIAVKVDTAVISAKSRGTPAGLTVEASANIIDADAEWDNTQTSDSAPYITAITGTVAADLPQAQFGSYTGSVTPAGSDPVIGFVAKLYNKVLGRDPEADGLNTWAYKLNTKQVSGATIAHEFFFSAEYKNKNVSDEEFVEDLYQTMMDRPSDDIGKAAWLNRLTKEGWTREQVLEGFVDSDEWGDICASYGIDR